ncbi:hypothetical protein HCB46_13405 [Listeria ivanovii]|nr:hypothetical protein [Listeria ivanovii]
MDYVFGKATGSKHNIERSAEMKQKLNGIGIFDNLSEREVVQKNLTEAFENKKSIQAIMTVLKEAIKQTNDCPYFRTFHSDQGWVYQMTAYSYTLKNIVFSKYVSKRELFRKFSIGEFLRSTQARNTLWEGLF